RRDDRGQHDHPTLVPASPPVHARGPYRDDLIDRLGQLLGWRRAEATVGTRGGIHRGAPKSAEDLVSPPCAPGLAAAPRRVAPSSVQAQDAAKEAPVGRSGGLADAVGEASR